MFRINFGKRRAGKKVVKKRGASQDVLKGTTCEEVRPQASKVEDVKKDLKRAYTKEQEEYVKGKIEKKLNVLTSPTKRV